MVGSYSTFGSRTGTDCSTTGTVMRKMISMTSMTSTRGVVLMSDIGVSSPSPDSPTCIAMIRLPVLVRRRQRGGAGKLAAGPEPRRLFPYGLDVLAAPVDAAVPVAVPAAGRVAAARGAAIVGRTVPPEIR